MSAITIEQLSAMLEEKLEEKLSPLSTTVAELRKSLDEVIKHMKIVDAKYDEFLNQMKTAEEERKALRTENKILKSTVQAMEKQLLSAMEESNAKNQYDRRECLEIRGIPEPTTQLEESKDDIVKKVGKLVGVDVTDNDIAVSHRLPPSKSYKGKKTGPPSIIVKFTRRVVKDRLYGARKNLSKKTTLDLGYPAENKIYLAESLTEKNRELFKQCLAAKKNLNFKFIWTKNEKIFMREERDSQVVYIKSKDDLVKIKATGPIQADK